MKDQVVKFKKISAYVNTTRIHWLVEELQKKGIEEIIVSEYFRPNSQISKLEFYSDIKLIEEFRSLIHNVGTCGKSPDHLFIVNEIEENKKSIFPFV